MEVQVGAMPINPSSKKRKGLFSVPSPTATRVPARGTLRSPLTAVQASAMASGTASASESVNLSLALTALKVSLKRDLESFAPPTPAVSPVHGRGPNKRARFDSGFFGEDAQVEKAHAAAPHHTTNALLAVSSRIKMELNKCRRRAIKRAEKPRRRNQLSYFAILGAFHRAAHEREVAMQLECVVEASVD